MKEVVHELKDRMQHFEKTSKRLLEELDLRE